MQTYSLFDLNEYIRRVIALNFNEPVWITAEIAEASLSKGHLYLSLIQQSIPSVPASAQHIEPVEAIVAQAQAILWQRDRRKLIMAHGQLAELALSTGTQTRLYVRVDFHERYGLKLHIEDIDPVHALVIMAMQRRKTIDWLRREDMMDRNRSLQLPVVLQRIAVITSQEAAGFQDFNTHLRQNIYGYRFQTDCFFAAVQGKNAETEIGNALDMIAQQQDNFDAVVIVRGGGSRLDLSVFDALELCKKVAAMPLPILAGVGHEIDESVLDMIAHSALKTPTAVADFIIEHNLQFEAGLVNTAAQINHFAARQVRYAADDTEQIRSQILRSAQGILSFSNGILDKISADLPVITQRRLQSERSRLLHFEQLAIVYSPENTLRRGYSLTTKNGKIVKSADELQPGDLLETQLSRGNVESTVALIQRPSSLSGPLAKT